MPPARTALSRVGVTRTKPEPRAAATPSARRCGRSRASASSDATQRGGLKHSMGVRRHHQRAGGDPSSNDSRPLMERPELVLRVQPRPPTRPQRTQATDPTDRARTCTKVRIQSRYTPWDARSARREWAGARRRTHCRALSRSRPRPELESPALPSTTGPGKRSAPLAGLRLSVRLGQLVEADVIQRPGRTPLIRGSQCESCASGLTRLSACSRRSALNSGLPARAPQRAAWQRRPDRSSPCRATR